MVAASRSSPGCRTFRIMTMAPRRQVCAQDQGEGRRRFRHRANQQRDFIVATIDEFAVFLRAVGASGRTGAQATPVARFWPAHPTRRKFSDADVSGFATRRRNILASMPNALPTPPETDSVFIRYQFVPRAGEHYLAPQARAGQSKTYLQDEILSRVPRAPIVFDWYAQIAEKGDAIADPSTAWPDTRRRVKLGTITITGQPADPPAVEQTLLFLPGQPHAEFEPADPMLVMRNTAYPISLGQRQ